MTLAELQYRAFDAAHDLDTLLDSSTASDWLAEKCRALIRLGRANDPDAFRSLGDVLEERLERERLARGHGQRQEVAT